jgi:hypothetical protein
MNRRMDGLLTTSVCRSHTRSSFNFMAEAFNANSLCANLFIATHVKLSLTLTLSEWVTKHVRWLSVGTLSEIN